MTEVNVKKNFISEVISSEIMGILSFTLITVVASRIAIPFQPVPFTFQTVAVVLAGAFLGAKNGMYSQLVYLFLGSIGLPVFAQVPGSSMGLAVLFGPTGGYLLAFPLAAFLTGYLLKNDSSYIKTVSVMFLSNIVIIAMGTLFLATFYLRNLSEAVMYGAVVFSLWTAVKVIISVNIFHFIKRK